MGATIIHGDARHLPLQDASVDALICDPPYDLTSGNGTAGFMGKKWDGTGVAFQPATWREAMRVLKPGGHLLAFGGMRTQHRLICAIEDAGFDIRDAVVWHFGSGFPKSLDVGKAIDKAGGDPLAWRAFSTAYAEVVESSTYTHADIDRHLGIKSSSCYWARVDHRGGMPPRRHWDSVRALLALPVTFERLYDEAEREVIGRWELPGRGKRSAEQAYGLTNDAGNITAPATDDARRWQGWGTALKPASEIICVARKPLAAGTVAANVLQWGCGALNVDRCRVPHQTVNGGNLADNPHLRTDLRSGAHTDSVFARLREVATPSSESGRWPSNVVLSHVGLTDVDGDIIGDACDPVCVDGCPVAELDAQSGVSSSRAASRGERHGAIYGNGNGPTGPDTVRGHDDSGGASRFFNVFRHSAGDQVFFPIESFLCGDGSTGDASTSAGRSTASSTENSPTDGSGSRPTETSPTATRSTTGTTTRSTTTSTTSCASPPNGTTTITNGSASNIDGSTESRNDAASAAANGKSSPSTTCAGPEPGRGTAARVSADIAVNGLAATGSSSTPAAGRSTPPDSLPDFPTFRYQAKAPTRERPKVNGVSHPTIKPRSLMSWLCRLVTPPGGTVLDMFAGSGTTLEAALLEGFNAIGVERSAEYLPLIQHRIDRAMALLSEQTAQTLVESSDVQGDLLGELEAV